MQIATLPRPELIQMADLLAREKGISKADVLAAMEQGISKAGRSKYGPEYDIRTQIDTQNGAIKMARYTTVVDEVEDEFTQIPLSLAIKKDANLKVGDEIIDQLPPMDFGRIAAQTAKQVISQKVREAERMHQFEEMIGRKGTVVNGLVKRVEGGNIVLEVNGVEALLRRDELIARETYRVGERLRAYVLDVRSEIKGPQVFLSRSHPQFLAKLFEAEVPEIYDGTIEVKAVARDPGSRAKVAVHSNDNTLDARGACIGARGVRVQAVIQELQGEKIDVIQWSSDPVSFIVNALAPSEVVKIVIDEESKNVEVVLSEDQLSLAIGRRGQNIRLISQLTGWHIDMMNEKQEAEHRMNETKAGLDLFMKALDIDDMMAHLLLQEGFERVEDVAFIALEELVSIEGFDEELAAELQNRAKAYLLMQQDTINKQLQDLNIADDLKDFEGITPEMLIKLGENDVKTLDDLADLAGDELMDIVGKATLNIDAANAMIMKAREHWFEKEDEKN